MFRIALFFLCGLFLSSCSDDEESVNFKTINLSPDIGAIDVFDGESLLFSSIGYTEASENTSLTVDSHELKVTLHNSFTTLFDNNISLRDNSAYTLFVFGFGEDANVVLDSDNSSNPSSGDQNCVLFMDLHPLTMLMFTSQARLNR